jgi:type I restriction enzyme S subunit
MSAWPDFPVPTDWRVLETRQIAERMRAGGTPSRKVEKYWDGDIPFVLIEDMTSTGLYLDRTKERITPAGLENSSTWLVPSGSVLLSMYATIGATAINRIPVATNQAILAIIPTKDHWPEFLVFCLRAHKEALSARNIQATQKNINKGIVETFPLPLPPFAEQQKIAGVLGLVQRAMEQQERLIEKTAELKKTLLYQLFTQGTRGEPQKQTDLGPVPESWELLEIGSLGKVVTGSTPKTNDPANYSPAEIDFIAPADLGSTKDVTDSEKKISRQGLASIRALPNKAVMCVCIGSSIGKVGMTTKESATNQQINSIVCNESHDPDFIFHQLIYRYDYWRGFATFGTVPILNKGRFQTIKLSIPKTRTEEVEIAAALNALESKLAHHRRKHATLSALFRTLLHQLMTAQLRVHDLDLPELSK